MTKDIDRLPPHAPKDEQAVLGCVLMEPEDCLPRVLEVIGRTHEAFYEPANQAVWRTMVELHEENLPPGMITLHQRLSERGRLQTCGGAVYLGGLPEMAPSAANLEYHLQVVSEKWRLRRVIQACATVISSAYDHRGDFGVFLDEVARLADSVESASADERATGKPLLLEYTDTLEGRHQRRAAGELAGLRTGLLDFDEEEGGLHLRQMMVVGGRPHEGKTALGCQFTYRVCIADKIPTLYLSLEMTRVMILDRLTAIGTGLSLKSISKGSFVNGDIERITEHNDAIRRAPIFIIERTGGMSSAEASASIRRYARRHSVKLVVLDYLQKLHPVGAHEKHTYGIGDTCERVRDAAVQSGVALVALAQLNREPDKAQKKRPPRLSDLADSKSIENEADTVALLQKDGNMRNLLIEKSRNSGGSYVHLDFDPVTLRFKSISKIDK